MKSMCCSLLLFLTIATTALAESSVPYLPPHAYDRATALSLARAQGKLVFLVESTQGCGNCGWFLSGSIPCSYKDNPDTPNKELLEEAYVYWLCEYEGQQSLCAKEMPDYDGDIRKNGYDLPFAAVIDPASPKKYIDRFTGAPDAGNLYRATLLPYIHMKAGPLFTNIKEGDNISDPSFVIQGESRWLNAIIPTIKVRINSGNWVEGESVLWKPPALPRTPSKWSYKLSREQLRKGTNTIEVRVSTKPLSIRPFDGAISKLSFQYTGN